MLNQTKQNIRNGSITIGIVKENMDPDRLGRLKVYVPNYNDNTDTLDIQWFWPCLMYGGYKDEGFFFIPNIGAEVVVMFPDGGESPVWLGCINKKKDNPGPRESTQEADDEHYYHRKQIKTKFGWIMFDDKDQYISLNHNNGCFVSLDKAGDVTIRAERNINIKAGKNVNIAAENGSFSVEAEHSSKLEAHNGDFIISADKGKLTITTLKDKLRLVSKDKMELIGEDDIKIYADKKVLTTSATDSIYHRAKKNVESYADEHYKIRANKDASIDAKSDLVLSADKDLYRYVRHSLHAITGESSQVIFGKTADIVVNSGDLNMATQSGNCSINATNDVTIHSDQKVSVNSTDDLNIQSNKNLNVSALEKVGIMAVTDIDIQSMMSLNIQALTEAAITGTTKLALTGMAIAELAGGTILKVDAPFIKTNSVTDLTNSEISIDRTSVRTLKSSATVDTSKVHVIRALRLMLG